MKGFCFSSIFDVFQRKLLHLIWPNIEKFKLNSVKSYFSIDRCHFVFLFVEDSAERADLAENQLGKLRAKNRSTVSASRTSPAVRKLLGGINFVFESFSFSFQRDLRESTIIRSTSMVRSSSVRPR